MKRRRLGLTLLTAVLLLASACGGGGGGGRNPSPPPSPRPGSLQFETSSVSVDESAGTASIAITRTGGGDGAVSATVASNDGSATVAGEDYTPLSATVTFAAGDTTAKTVTVAIADNSEGEADETLSLTLSAPTGGASLGANAAVTLTIQDNDPPPPPTLELSADIKQLKFTWASATGATSYQLLQKPDSTSGFGQVAALAADATSATLDIAVHRHDWVNARYRLEACNERGCSGSAEVSAVDLMLQAIGYLKATDTEAGDRLGFSVALSVDGTTLAAGAIGKGGSFAGAVYVLIRDGAAWSQQALLKGSNIQPGDFFGETLGLSADGNTLAVGAPEDDVGARNAGAVYVFTRDGTQWSEHAYVKAANAPAEYFFGDSVALSADGKTLAVGATGESSFAGSAYVFIRDAEIWSQQAFLESSNAQARGFFGDSVALSGDGNTLAVGADGENGFAGSAYVFIRDGEVWSQQAFLRASNAEAEDSFGRSVALSGDGNTLAVGASEEDGGAKGVGGAQNEDAENAGAVYVFTRAQTQWSEQAYVKASNTGPFDGFGTSVALSADGSTLAVGAHSEDDDATGVGGPPNSDGAPDAGAVYGFTRAETEWSQLAYVKASNTEKGDLFGRSLALSADGSTLLVGAAGEDGGARTTVGGDQNDNSADFAGAMYAF